MRPLPISITPCVSAAPFFATIRLEDLSASDLQDCRTMAFEALADANRDGTQDDIDRAESNIAYLSSIVPTGRDHDPFEFYD